MSTSSSFSQTLRRFPWLPEPVACKLVAMDWSRRTLGPPDRWPQALDPLLQLCLLSTQPTALVWGPAEGHLFNQAWADHFAGGSWSAVGASFTEAWKTVWGECAQVYQRAASGESVWLQRVRVFVASAEGKRRECFFSFSATPVMLAGADKPAILITARETTRDLLARRRIDILHTLASQYRELNTVEANCQWFLDTLVSHEAEVPVAAVYCVDEREGGARQLCSSGPNASTGILPAVIGLKGAGSAWRFLEAIDRRELTVIHSVPDTLGIRLSGCYPEPIESFIVFPITRRRQDFPPAILLMAASPRLALDDNYLHFFGLLGISFRQLMTGTYARQRWAEANAALIASEQRYRAIVEGQSEMVCRFRPDGTILFVNGAYARALNAQPEEVEATNFWDYVAEEDRPAVADLLARITPDNPEVNIENRFHIGGSNQWTRWSNRGLRFDEQGRPVEIQSTGMDISDRRRAEEALQDRELQLRLALQGANAGAWSLDISTGTTFWSQGFRALYGFSADAQPRLSTWVDSIHPDDRDRVRRTFRERPLSTRSEYQQEFRIIHPQRGVRWLLAQGRVERDDSGTALRISGINIDITERKAVEQALRESEERLKEADRRKDEFLATLAHELRNPLAPIRNSLEVIRLAGDDKAALHEARAIMERQLAHMVHLINDLLDLSRISRGKVTLRKEPVSIGTVISQAVEICRPLIDEAEHELEIGLPQDEVRVHADQARLAQVFANLLSNASKFTARGGKISLAVHVLGEQIEVRVKDTGAGISADLLEKVFDMFVQAEADQQVQGGLGIGLSLVRGLVDMHGGEVTARSGGPGQGSEFVVRLPLLRDAAEDATAKQRIQDQQVDSLRILVVDDNQDAANSMATMLELMGHETRVAFDGLAALAMAAEFPPDVALLDIGMPRLNGFETARRLRQQSSGASIKLVALTGWGQAEDRRRSREAGFDAHLVKPVDLSMLNDLLTTQRPGSNVQGDEAGSI